MKEALQKRCEVYLENRNALEKISSLEHGEIYPICANIFALKEMVITKEKYVECKNILKDKTGFLSNFRGNISAPVIATLATSVDPVEKCEYALSIYDQLKAKLRSSEYLALASMFLTDFAQVDQIEKIVERSYELYSKMRETHPFFPMGETNTYAVLLAMSEKSNDEMLKEMDYLYTELKKHFHNSTAVQALSNVLALGYGKPEEKVEKLVAINKAIQENGRKFDHTIGVPMLSALVLSKYDVATIVQDLLEVDSFLDGKKGYGLFGTGKATRLVHAAMILSGYYTEQNLNRKVFLAGESSAINAALASIAVQQAAICASIAASVTAATSTQ